MATFELWAPKAAAVILRLGSGSATSDHPMIAAGDGRWSVEAPDAGPGTDYAFLLDDDPTPLPDPRSRWQPHDVHGPSRVHDRSGFDWSDGDWRGVGFAGSVVYELHVGTFTAPGTLDAAIDRLDHLVDLGIDLVELLPVNAFNGDAGWGYDGVAWFAVHAPYGGPDALKRFVDAAHARGLGVLLDVVYNHLGPSGAYLDRFGPYFTDAHHTPWGPGLNLDGPGSDEVRRYICDNARMWLAEFHFDGLRLDAVHALVDGRATHILEELAEQTDALAVHCGRPLCLIAESDQNDPRLVLARSAGGLGLTAQWSDDLHHALHALLTGERQGYYDDFGSLDTLAQTLTSVFFHDGRYSTFRGRHHGRPVDRHSATGAAFLAYLQDHDQVGNRATGDRITATVSDGLAKVGAALYLTGPGTPMVFMGEEWAASTPWQFFTSHPEPDLAEAVRTGRRREFAAHGWEHADVPDPQDPATVAHSRLRWDEREEEPHAAMLDFYRSLIALRHDRAELTDPRLDRVAVDVHDDGPDDRWVIVHRGQLRVVANLSRQRRAIPIDRPPMKSLLASAPGFVFSPGEVTLDGESVVILELA